MKDCYITFPRITPGRHPVRNTVIYRIELTDLVATAPAADSSIARFTPKEATLTRDATGVTLKLTTGDEFMWGYGRLDDIKNVPVKVGGK